MIATRDAADLAKQDPAFHNGAHIPEAKAYLPLADEF